MELAFPGILLEVSHTETSRTSTPQVRSGTTNTKPLAGADRALCIPMGAPASLLIPSKAGWAGQRGREGSLGERGGKPTHHIDTWPSGTSFLALPWQAKTWNKHEHCPSITRHSGFYSNPSWVGMCESIPWGTTIQRDITYYLTFSIVKWCNSKHELLFPKVVGEFSVLFSFCFKLSPFPYRR